MEPATDILWLCLLLHTPQWMKGLSCSWDLTAHTVTLSVHSWDLTTLTVTLSVCSKRRVWDSGTERPQQASVAPGGLTNLTYHRQ